MVATGPQPASFRPSAPRSIFKAIRLPSALNPTSSMSCHRTLHLMRSSPAAETSVTVDVLANDGSLSSTLVPSSVVISAAPANGSALIDPSTGKITYTPAKGFSGTDTFTYVVMDTLGLESAPTNVDVVVGAEAGHRPAGAPSAPPTNAGPSPSPLKGGRRSTLVG